MVEHPDMQTFELDDTNDHLSPVGNAVESAIRDEYDVPEDATVVPYVIDADASHEEDGVPVGKFEVEVLVLEE